MKNKTLFAIALALSAVVLAARREIDYPTYLDYWHAPDGASDVEMPHDNPAPYRLAAIKNHRRYYDGPASV